MGPGLSAVILAGGEGGGRGLEDLVGSGGLAGGEDGWAIWGGEGALDEGLRGG